MSVLWIIVGRDYDVAVNIHRVGNSPLKPAGTVSLHRISVIQALSVNYLAREHGVAHYSRLFDSPCDRGMYDPPATLKAPLLPAEKVSPVLGLQGRAEVADRVWDLLLTVANETIK